MDPSQGLPEGWSAVMSSVRPGELSYENTYTQEVIDWIPRKEASPEVESSPDLFPNMGLPSGWMAAESNSNLGVVVYENVFTVDGAKSATASCRWWMPSSYVALPSRVTLEVEEKVVVDEDVLVLPITVVVVVASGSQVS